MIEKYAEKKETGLITSDFGENGNTLLFERKYDQLSGSPYLHSTPTNSKHIEDLIDDRSKVFVALKDELENLHNILDDVRAKEKERDEIIAEKAKEQISE